jgi:tetratricopeptide (TPR) repeat protein
MPAVHGTVAEGRGRRRLMAPALAAILMGVVAALATTLVFFAYRRLPSVPARPAPSASAALARDPRLGVAYDALARSDYITALRECARAEQQGVPAPALEAVRSAIFRETDYLDRELESYQRWAKAAPDDATPWLRLFYLYADLGWKREADHASREALRRAPHEPRAHVARATFLDRYVGPDEALAEIDTARRLKTDNDAALSNLRAIVLLKAGNEAEAEAEIRRAIEQEPSSVAHRLVLAQSLLGQNRLDEAHTSFTEVLRRDPKNVEAAYQLGLIAEQQNDPLTATRHFERAAALDARHDSTLWHLTRLYRQQGRHEESKRLARLYGTMKRNTTAFESVLSQLDERPGDLKLHWHLALKYLGAEEYSKAIVELRAIAQFEPDDRDVRRALHIALTKAGRLTEAREFAPAALKAKKTQQQSSKPAAKAHR